MDDTPDYEDQSFNEDEKDGDVESDIVGDIVGDKFNQYVVFTISVGQVIVAYASPMYTVGSIEIADLPLGKQYSTKSKGSVAFGSFFQNSIVKIDVNKDKPLFVNKSNILASTDNIQISSGSVKCIKDSVGYVWLSAAGNHEDIELKDGNAIAINSGIYLMSDISPTINENGNYLLTAPCKLIIQTKNIKSLMMLMQGSAKPSVVGVSKPQPLEGNNQMPNTLKVLQSSNNNVQKPAEQPPKRSWFSNLFGMKGGAAVDFNRTGFKEENYDGSIRSILRDI
jgi:hypothetical protein